MKPSRFKTAGLLAEYLKKQGHTDVKLGLFDYDHTIKVRYRDKDTDDPLEIIVQQMLREDDPVGVINNEEKILELINS